MGQIGTGFSIRQDFITELSLDVCDRTWIREVRYEKDSTNNSEWIINSVSRQKIMDISDGCENNNIGARWHKFDNNLYYIQTNGQNDDGTKDIDSILYEINKSTGYIFRISHMYIGFGYHSPESQMNGNLIYNEAPESYANILYYIKRNRENDVKDLFIRVNGKYVNFLDNIDDLIGKIFHM